VRKKRCQDCSVENPCFYGAAAQSLSRLPALRFEHLSLPRRPNSFGRWDLEQLWKMIKAQSMIIFQEKSYEYKSNSNKDLGSDKRIWKMINLSPKR
jgi:hypothetical protein